MTVDEVRARLREMADELDKMADGLEDSFAAGMVAGVTITLMGIDDYLGQPIEEDPSGG